MKGFDWNEANKDKNWIKHKVSIKESEQIFFDQQAVQFEDKNHSQLEKRYKILGVTKKGRRLHVTFTIREDKIRIISARDQSRKERKLYEQIKQK